MKKFKNYLQENRSYLAKRYLQGTAITAISIAAWWLVHMAIIDPMWTAELIAYIAVFFFWMSIPIAIICMEL